MESKIILKMFKSLYVNGKSSPAILCSVLYLKKYSRYIEDLGTDGKVRNLVKLSYEER